MRQRVWIPLAGVSVMIVTSLSIYLVATHLNPHAPERAGKAKSGSPAEVIHQNQPKDHSQEDLAKKGDVPILQRNATAGEVTRDLELSTQANTPGFDKTLLKAKRGDVISLHFKNNSNPALHYRHSFVLTKPGRSGNVILEASRAGAQFDFIPKTGDVLAASHLIGPGETDTVIFRAPEDPGDYPYICTFPGHGLAMHGVLRID